MARKKTKKRKNRKRRSRTASPPPPPRTLDPVDALKAPSGLAGEDEMKALEAALDQMERQLFDGQDPQAALDEQLLDLLRPRPRTPGLPDPDLFEDAFAPLDDEPKSEADEVDPEFPERCFPPIRLRIGGADANDPYATLGLSPGASRDEILAAFRSRLEHASPEDAPEIAAQLNDARSLLLDHDRVFERLLGEILVPDPDAWNLDRGEPATAPIGAMAPEARLCAQLLLYALVEEQAIDALRS